MTLGNGTALLLSAAIQLLAMVVLCVGVDVCRGDALGSLSIV